VQLEMLQATDVSLCECYLRDIKVGGRAELENSLTSVARMKPAKTPMFFVFI
jgi:hypothetical protein